MASLAHPTHTATRSDLADWLELKALTSPKSNAVEADVIGLRELYTGSEDEDSTEDGRDEAIIEAEQEAQLQSLANEFAYRARILGTAYPFELGSAGILLTFNPASEMNPGQCVYLFCLLCSAFKNGSVQPADALADLISRIPNLFQACACASAAGYLSGAVCSFGFPRATGDGFHPALKAAFARVKEGQVHDNPTVPPGKAAEVKDGGIDVIAWKDAPDMMPGKVYLIGQCASGNNWRDKSVKEYLDQFHGNWFAPPPPSTPIPAMFIPFAFHQRQEENGAHRFEDVTRLNFQYDTPRFGIIHDRFRIAHFAGLVFGRAGAPAENIDGLTQYPNIQRWVTDARAIVTEGLA